MKYAYAQDESGQWWCHETTDDGKPSRRLRSEVRVCAKPECGKDFVRWYKSKYCSRDCANNADADNRVGWRKEQTCEKCGEQFWNRHTQKFCSKECRGEVARGRPRKIEPDRECPICKATFNKRPQRPWRKTCGDPKCVRALADQHRGYLSGPDHPHWVGGTRYQTKSGYVMVYAGKGLDSRLEHRVVMEGVLGRPLQRFEEVHHRNAVRNDNRPENLELWVKRQPGGSRAKDLIEYAHWILETYGPLEDKL